MSDETLSYSQAAERLDAILRAIENESADIDELSKLVDEAAGLVKLCRAKIQAAEVQVNHITAELQEAGDETEQEPLAEVPSPSIPEDDIPF